MKKLFYIVVGIMLFACDDREIAFDDNFGFIARTISSEEVTTRIFRDEIIHFEIISDDSYITDQPFNIKYNVSFDKEGTLKNTVGPFLNDLKQDSLYPIKHNDSLVFTPLSVGEVSVEFVISDNFGKSETLENKFQVSSIPFKIELENGGHFVNVKVKQVLFDNAPSPEQIPLYDVDYFLKIEDSSEVRKLDLPNGNQEISVGDIGRQISTVNNNIFYFEELPQGEHLLAIAITDEYGQTENASMVIIKN